ncbi:MAG: hypothetical protein H7A22_02120 [Spirochaetales bacterium]|nr:hypothetical protein [Spirochaetales bacterium]
MSPPQLEENARRLVDIARHTTDRVAGRRLLRTAMADNPHVGRLAADLLDEPAFVLEQITARELDLLLRSLSNAELRALRSEPEFQKLADGRLSQKRLNEIDAIPPANNAKDGFFRLLAERVLEGAIAFDMGLLFGRYVECAGIGAQSDLPGSLLVLDPTVQIGADVEVILSAPSGSAVTVALQLGDRILHEVSLYIPREGVLWATLPTDSILKKLPADVRSRSIVALLTLRNRTVRDVYQAAQPLVLVPDTGAADLAPPLAVRAAGAVHRSAGEMRINASVREANGNVFSGRGAFRLQCLHCGSTLGQTEFRATTNGNEELHFSFDHHPGTLLLGFEAEGSLRCAVLLIPPAPAINGIESGPELHCGPRVPGSKPVRVQLSAEPDTVIIGLLEPAGEGALIMEALVDALRRPLVYPANGEALLRARGLFMDLKPDHRRSVVLGQSLHQKGKVCSLNFGLMPPGEYRVRVLSIKGERYRLSESRLTVDPALLIQAPPRIHSDDHILATLEVPPGLAERALTLDGRSVEVKSTSAGSLYQIELNRDAPGFLLENESGRQERVSCPVMDQLGQSTEWILTPHHDDGDSGGPGQEVLSLDETVVLLLSELWRYSMACAEQVSTRLFAVALLKQMQPSAKVDPDQFRYLCEELEGYYDSDLGLFRVWEGMSANLRTTIRVLRSLSVYKNSDSRPGQLLRSALGRLQAEVGPVPQLAYLVGDSRDQAATFASIWEQWWRRPAPASGNGLMQFLPAIVDQQEKAAAENGFWSDADRLAVLFALGSSVGDPHILYKKESKSEAEAGFLRRLLISLGVARPIAPRTLSSVRKFKNPFRDAGTFQDAFWKQGGATLFGTTTGTMHLVQALLALRATPAGTKLKFVKSPPPPDFQREVVQQTGVTWRAPAPRLRRGEIISAGVQVEDPSLRTDGLFRVHAPSNCEIVSVAGGYRSLDGSYGELPLRNRQTVSLKLRGRLSGRARMSMACSSMYNPSCRATWSEMIEVVK